MLRMPDVVCAATALRPAPRPRRGATPVPPAADAVGDGLRRAGRGNPGDIRGTVVLDRGVLPGRAGTPAPAATVSATYRFPGPSTRFGSGPPALRQTDHPARAASDADIPGAKSVGDDGAAARTRSDAPLAVPRDNAAQATASPREGAFAVPGPAATETPGAAVPPGMPPRAEVPRVVIPMHFGAGRAGGLPPANAQHRAAAGTRMHARRRLATWLAVAGTLLAWIALWAL